MKGEKIYLKPNWTKILVTVYILSVLFCSVKSFIKPEFNFDGLAYIGIIHSISETNDKIIHKKTYDEYKRVTPKETFKLLTKGDTYRTSLYKNPKYFVSQFPFYTIKPLYLLLVYIVNKIGINIIYSTITVSILSYIGICTILLFWLKKVEFNIFLTISTIILVTSPPITSVARLSTPDMLSAFVLITGIYVGIIVRKRKTFVSLLLLSLFARIDNVVIVFPLLFWMRFITKKEKFKITNKEFIIANVLGLSIYIIVTKTTSNYGWGSLMYHSFIKSLNNPSTFKEVFTTNQYFFIIKNSLLNMFNSSFMTFIMLYLVGFLILSKLKTKILNNLHFQISTISLATMVGHFLLFPSFEDRFYTYQYIVIFIITMVTVKEKINNKEKFT